MTSADSTKLLIGGAIAVGIFYYLSKAGSAVAGAVSAGTNAVAGGIASTYLDLTLAPAIKVNGNAYVNGTEVGPVSSFQAANDSQGNTYLAVNGQWYQMSSSLGGGNYGLTATGQSVASTSSPTAVTATSTGATGTTGSYGTGAT